MPDITNQQVKDALRTSYDEVIQTLQDIMRHAHNENTHFQDDIFKRQSAQFGDIEFSTAANMPTAEFIEHWFETAGQMNIPDAPIYALHGIAGDLNTAYGDLLHFTNAFKLASSAGLTDETCEGAITTLRSGIPSIAKNNFLEDLRKEPASESIKHKYYGSVSSLLSLQFIKSFTDKLGIEGIECSYQQPIDNGLKPFFPELVPEKKQMQSSGSNAKSIETGKTI